MKRNSPRLTRLGASTEPSKIMKTKRCCADGHAQNITRVTPIQSSAENSLAQGSPTNCTARADIANRVRWKEKLRAAAQAHLDAIGRPDEERLRQKYYALRRKYQRARFAKASVAERKTPNTQPNDHHEH